MRPRARLPRHPLVADALLALALFAVEAVASRTAGEAIVLWRVAPPPGPSPSAPETVPLALAWALLGVLPVLVRRRWPAAMVALASVHTAAPFLLHIVQPRLAAVAPRPAGTAILVVTYTAAAYLPLRRAVPAAVAVWLPGLALALVLNAVRGTPLGLPGPYFVAVNLLVALVCGSIGRTVHTRREYLALLEDRARTAELNRQASTAQAVADERRRIARELHDVVAHHVSVMSVLASGSRRMLRQDPAAAGEALATIEETGRTALRELRRLLEVLRTEPEPTGEPSPRAPNRHAPSPRAPNPQAPSPRAPNPQALSRQALSRQALSRQALSRQALSPRAGLDAVAALVEQVCEAGLPVSLAVSGTPPALDPGVALTVYRIVQEALTNSLKHAGDATAQVCLTFGNQSLVVEVYDTGRGPRLDAEPAGPGHGLLGMRERVTRYGGVLQTGPRPGGGFRVYAKIPVEAVDGAAERGADGDGQ